MKVTYNSYNITLIINGILSCLKNVHFQAYVFFYVHNSIAKYPHLGLQELTLKHLQAETLFRL